MRKTNKQSIILAGVITLGMAMMFTGCGSQKKKIKYGKTKGVVTGSVTLTEDDAQLQLDNVQAEAGEDIDYTSQIQIEGDGEYSMDVNASNVKNDTPGTYTATYHVKSGNKSYSDTIKVTIQKAKNAGSDDSANAPSNGGSAQEHAQTPEGNNHQPSNGESAQEHAQTPEGNDHQPSNGENAQKNAQGSTQKKVLVTDGSKTKYPNKSIGNTSIELLSGDVVTINCATNKYIVETKTVEHEVTKKGHTYLVTKLVVVFNTGKEQTVETIEKRID